MGVANIGVTGRNPYRDGAASLYGTFSSPTRVADAIGKNLLTRVVNATWRRSVWPPAPAVSRFSHPFFLIFPTVATITIAITVISATRRYENPERVAVLSPRVAQRARNRKRSLDFTGFRRCHVVRAPTWRRCNFDFSSPAADENRDRVVIVNFSRFGFPSATREYERRDFFESYFLFCSTIIGVGKNDIGFEIGPWSNPNVVNFVRTSRTL